MEANVGGDYNLPQLAHAKGMFTPEFGAFLVDCAADKGKPARIIAKLNAIVEPEIIKALYRASQAGVQIDLIVRGACTLRPGVPGISDNIRVRSIVGRFLEHHRVYWFANDGEPDLFCSSADWLERNLLRRVETGFPVREPALAQRVYEEALDNYLRDNVSAWTLQPDGHYVRLKPGEGEPPHLGMEIGLSDLDRPQQFRPTPLQEAQIAGVIDAGRKIRVLVVDADGQDMGAVLHRPGEMRPGIHRLTPPRPR